MSSQVFILGTALRPKNTVAFELLKFYGVGRDVAARICARYQIHSKQTVEELNQHQIVGLSSFMGSPSTSAPLPGFPRASPDFVPSALSDPLPVHPQGPKVVDTLRNLRLENDLRRTIRDNIAHHKNIGSYVGRRHVQGLPVRGQNTRTNAVTARKLNRLERRV
ncbi:mitochondrial 30S ribosomal protein S13 [Auriculariales sp. MPI-PUGE-AT-0066]|nr:mitochondrial 30S ribosomal protein S13 [Auriculariales sp. MPI-PUGE-AT-0066]